jgi:RES domain-containing protein
MATLYRLTKARYAATAFRGSRGRGRWHRLGTPVVYAADSPATALLEILVHIGEAEDVLAEPYVVFEIDLPEKHIVVLDAEELPPNWNAWPWTQEAQDLGTLWYEERVSVALGVPSAVVPRQRNYLLNTEHPDYADAKITGPMAFEIDPRLVKRR